MRSSRLGSPPPAARGDHHTLSPPRHCCSCRPKPDHVRPRIFFASHLLLLLSSLSLSVCVFARLPAYSAVKSIDVFSLAVTPIRRLSSFSPALPFRPPRLRVPASARSGRVYPRLNGRDEASRRRICLRFRKSSFTSHHIIPPPQTHRSIHFPPASTRSVVPASQGSEYFG